MSLMEGRHLLFKKDLVFLFNALWGSRAAREDVARSRKDAVDFQARLADIMERWPDQLGYTDSAPVFVFAAGWRTGSTLLQRLLMSSGEIMIWGEPYNRSRLTAAMMEQFRAITKDWPFDYYAGNAFDGDISSQWVANIYPCFRHLIGAHRAYFKELFEIPSQAMDRPRWGFKEVRLTSEHAMYLKLLYPNAKFIFLYRDPIKAYASFRGYIKFDYWAWPHKPILTPTQYGRMWCYLVEDFARNFSKLDGVFIKYEDLIRDPSVVQDLSAYVQANLRPVETIARVAGRHRMGTQDKVSPENYISLVERKLLLMQVGRLRSKLGYD